MADVEVSIVLDNTQLVKESTEQAILTALEAIGMRAEGYAKMKCPVDTGLLRNSITHAVSGGSAAISSYHASYGSNKHWVTNKQGKRSLRRYSASSNKAGAVGYGTYSGSVGVLGEKAVYIGSNLSYASYVEKGTSHQKAQPFLEPAVTGHTREYKRIFEEQLERLSDI